MRPLVTPDEMAAADAATIRAGTPAEVLMERAGKGVARVAIELVGGRYGRRVTVVCGKGNNGGDGFVAARVLRAQGLSVKCLSVGEVEGAQGAARHHLDALKARGVTPMRFHPDAIEGSDLVIDAMFGTGFRGRAEGDAAEAIAAIDAAGCPVVAVDIPSGVNGATGEVDGVGVHADVTIAMAAQKLGTAIGDGAIHSGVVEVVDIGIQVAGTINFLERTDVVPLIPPRPPDSHKRSSGSVLVIAGSDAMPGAAALVVRGAMRAGCGYVTVACTEKVGAVVNELCPEALVRVVTDLDHLGPGALEGIDDVLAKANAVAAGPGLGTGDDQTALVKALAAKVDVPLILDADGLNALPGGLDILASRSRATAITPHPVELSRLMGVDIKELGDRVDAARDAADRGKSTVLLKGSGTVISGASSTYVNPTGGPELATAGTGDVLSGIVAALVANRGDADAEVVAAAAYVHGLAGSVAADRVGEHGVVAWDVAEVIPEAMDLIEGTAP